MTSYKHTHTHNTNTHAFALGNWWWRCHLKLWSLWQKQNEHIITPRWRISFWFAEFGKYFGGYIKLNLNYRLENEGLGRNGFLFGLSRVWIDSGEMPLPVIMERKRERERQNYPFIPHHMHVRFHFTWQCEECLIDIWPLVACVCVMY